MDDPDESFTAIEQVLIGDGEQLYVLQQRGNAIRVYDRTGNLVNRIGRSGRGPGEFVDVDYMGFWGDTLYASDDGLGRISFFSSAGQFLNSIPWVTSVFRSSGMTYQPTTPTILLQDGTALVKPVYGFVIPAEFHEPGVHRPTIRFPFLRVDQQARVLDTLVWGETHPAVIRLSRQGAGFALNPFASEPLLALMPDGSGVVVVERHPPSSEVQRAAIQVVLVGPDADTVFSTRIPYRPIPLTDARLHELVEEVASPATTQGPPSTEGRPSLSNTVGVFRNADLIPPSLVPVSALGTGQDGSIWLGREDTGRDSTQWQVLDARGYLEGTVHLPRGQTVVAASGDIVIAVEKNEYDVPFILKYRLQRR